MGMEEKISPYLDRIVVFERMEKEYL